MIVQRGGFSMKKQIEESKHDKFVRLAEARTNKIIDTLQLLGNCSNTSVYEYTQDEVEEIFQAIEQELRAAKKKFTKVEPEKTPRFSLSKCKR
jgi:hypothetical protein